MLDGFIHWLGDTQASLVISKVFWIIPTVQIAHILAISVVLASMAMFDLRLLGLAGTRSSIATGWRLKPIAEPLIVCTHAQTAEEILRPKHIAEQDLRLCEELGATLASGLALGIF